MNRALSLARIALAALFAAVPAASAHAEEAAPPRTLGRIERVDPRLDKLIPADATIEVLAEGFQWSEGPVWVGRTTHLSAADCLLFSDIPNNVVMKWRAGEGISVFLKPAGYTGAVSRGGELGSNGLAIDPQGRLVLCQHGDRQIARLERDGRFTVLASKYEGKRFNSPNDLAFKSNGDLYFTDPPYGLSEAEQATLGELGFCGVYRLAPDGHLTLLTRELTRPNGIAFSPDERTLYVANSDRQRALWMAYPVQPDGALGPGRVFFDATPWTAEFEGLPDGLKVDREGNLFATGPGGVNVFAPDGTFLGRIQTGQATANCAFGGATLYITADMYLCRVKTTTRAR